ncbi:hypothetical protein OCAR_6072 [Afipia carboxidovorans OM5]|nr:hypothetical protein OCAR_6072 [Afipia carboxidovorans OM5]
MKRSGMHDTRAAYRSARESERAHIATNLVVRAPVSDM